MAHVGMIEIPLSVLSGARPEVIPTRGERRIVKLVETPVGWGHAVWTSPYTVEDSDLNLDGSKVLCRVCVVLVGKGPPKPEPLIMTIPISYLLACPEDVVEW
jgi:hypothetical protein